MFPYKISSLAERESFYAKEFSTKALEKWFLKMPQFFAIDFGSETGISVDPSKNMKIIFLQPPNMSLKQLQQKLVSYKPEDVYYDTTVYKDPTHCASCTKQKSFCADCDNVLGKELVFDVDPENIDCPACGKKEFPNFCSACLKQSLKKGVELASFLKQNYGYKKLRLVYSGRGCHVHVGDASAFKLAQEERKQITDECKQFGIDPWVTTEKRLVRLPYSLNTIVSRIVIPLEPKEVDGFDAETDKRVIPKFLQY